MLRNRLAWFFLGEGEGKVLVWHQEDATRMKSPDFVELLCNLYRPSYNPS